MSTDPLPGVPGGDRTAADGEPGGEVALVRLGERERRVTLHLSGDLRRRRTAGAADRLAATLRAAAPRPAGGDTG
ncbi:MULTISPECIES: hypothetical protein [Catenuloplanes]|uniref:Uncharacterized protein n=1 Tax=Catenuloplanes niger TaxID=587534 RepID=A0AAE3ZLP0_9ACTN|nr:hypothetical protein [Catenuloplanes niger]MDR7320900.1 hypothetical protein [Catenuloplanes niger]